MTGKWKTRLVNLWRGWIVSILVALLIVTSFRSAIADWNDVPTGSMKPTILEGDRIFVNKLAYDLKVPFTTWRIAQWDNPGRGDIVVFFSPQDGKRLVKRVVGLPGDTIAMRDNRVYIDNKAATYEKLDPESIPGASPELSVSHLFFSEILDGRKHALILTPKKFSFSSFEPVTIPEGHYLMMGDNRDNSADSRFFGLVERESIVGRASTVVISLKPDEHYLPRWSRFFKKLM